MFDRNYLTPLSEYDLQTRLWATQAKISAGLFIILRGKSDREWYLVERFKNICKYKITIKAADPKISLQAVPTLRAVIFALWIVFAFICAVVCFANRSVLYGFLFLLLAVAMPALMAAVISSQLKKAENVFATLGIPVSRYSRSGDTSEKRMKKP